MKIILSQSPGDPLGDLMRRLTQAVIRPAVGQATAELTRRHLYDFGQANPGKMSGEAGYRSTRFYETAGNRTSFVETTDGVAVNIVSEGIRLQVEGGVVRPVKAKMLTIPAIGAAHGHAAREFPFLRFAKLGNSLALVETEQVKLTDYGQRKLKGKKKIAAGERWRAFSHEKGGTVYYWLALETHHDPHPEVVPDEDAFVSAGKTALDSLLP